MLSPRWRKVRNDLWVNKTRTVLMILSIAVGICAVGIVVGSQVILSHDMASSYAAGNPADAFLYTEPFDDDLLQTIHRLRSVRNVEERRRVNVRLKVGPDKWRTLSLIAIPDYHNIQINIVRPIRGAWPPQKQELLIERSALSNTQANIGDMVLIETSDGTQRSLRIAGTAHDNTYLGPIFNGGIIWGYVTFETLEWLGEPLSFNELHFVVAEEASDKAHIENVTNQVTKKIDKSGLTIWNKMIFTPGEHPASFLIQAMMELLGVLGVLTLFLSGFLVANTLSALLTQHVRQIGIMKAVGARTGQLIGMYLVLILIFGLFALVVAIPLATLATRAITSYVASLMNFNLGNFNVPLQMILIQLVVGLLTPVLAAAYPVITGTHVTVREAISNYGLGKSRFGTSVIDRLLMSTFEWGVSRPLLLSLRNTFRRKGRLALTLVTLTLGGTIFICVFSVQESLVLTRNDLMSYFLEDVSITFNRPYRIAKIEQEALSVPSVVRVEGWNAISTRRLRADNSESNSINLNGIPKGSDLVQPIIVEGRWLHPEDKNAIVIGNDLKRAEPDIRVGDDIVLKIKDRKTTWRVVGVVLVMNAYQTTWAYANESDVARVAGRVGQARSVKLVTTQHDAAFQAKTAQALEEHFNNLGFRVLSIRTNGEVNTNIKSQFNIIVIFLSIMAVLISIVGGLSLMGTMSMNVLERTREIGVLRAIGASNSTVQQIVIAEGVLIGVLSWLLGSVLALPISKMLSDRVGVSFLHAPLRYTFSITGVLLWLIAVIVLAILATFLPAWNASRLKIRETLTYK